VAALVQVSQEVEVALKCYCIFELTTKMFHKSLPGVVDVIDVVVDISSNVPVVVFPVVVVGFG
jgi:hypothetical protein